MYFINTITLMLISLSMQAYSTHKPACYNLISLDQNHAQISTPPPHSYVNKDAPKGGTLRQGLLTRFNSLNPFLLKGIAPAPIWMIYDSLFNDTENAIHLQGQLAECVEINNQNQTLIFVFSGK